AVWRGAAGGPGGLRVAAPRPAARRLPRSPASTPGRSADRRTAVSTSQNHGEADRSPDAKRPLPALTRKTRCPKGDLPPPPMHKHSAWLLQELLASRGALSPTSAVRLGPRDSSRGLVTVRREAVGR